MSTAKAGDIISLAGGNYGDVTISKQFSSDVTIVSASDTSPATFHSIALAGSSHIKLDSIAVNFTPTATTVAWSPAVSIDSSTYITFSHSTVTGGDAVNGVPQTATALDSTGNVLGLPTGYGILISKSAQVTVEGVEVSEVGKGISLNSSDYVTISHSDIHDMRTSGIVAGGGSHITIDSNHIHDSNPWRWGQTPIGDHADYIAMWTNAGQTTASTDIKITNNLMEQGSGTAVLGMWMQGNAATYTNVQISGNAILNGNFQGISLWDVHGASVDHNTLLQTSGDTKSAPGVLLSTGAQNVAVHDNGLGAVNDLSGSTGSLANSFYSNTILQKWLASASGYYTSALITSTEAAHDITGLYGVAGVGTTSGGTTSGGSTSGGTTSGGTTSGGTTSGGTTSGGTAGGSTPTGTDTGGATTTNPGSGSTLAGVVINGSYTAQNLTGTSGADTFFSKTLGDTLSGGAGDDVYNVIGGTSKTLVVEAIGGGTDTVISKGDYTLGANVENLTISDTATNGWSGVGNGLNNVITGNGGANYLDGGAGTDTIFGGAGNDTLIGGAGDDRLTGGLGKDTFRFDKGSGHDTITDFSKVDHDVLDISGYLNSGYKPTLTDVGTDVKVSFATGDYIILTGLHAKDLIATSSGFTA